MKGRLADVAAAVGGRLAGADAEFNGVSTDSRTIEAGMLFVALAGERFDGNAFVAAAAARGAAGAVVSKAADGALPHVIVGDDDAVRKLFGRFAHQRALAGIALAAASEHDQHAAASVRTHRRERLGERVRRVRVVDNRERAVR